MRVALLTVSDRASSGERPDASGPALRERVTKAGWTVVRSSILPDEQPAIEALLREWADSGEADVILTTGGTGVAPRDRTPEATQAVCERQVPGIAEVMRYSGLRTTPHAMLSRGIAGIRKRSLIVNLPGSPRAAVESLDAVLEAIPHAVELIQEAPSSERGHHKPPPAMTT